MNSRTANSAVRDDVSDIAVMNSDFVKDVVKEIVDVNPSLLQCYLEISLSN